DEAVRSFKKESKEITEYQVLCASQGITSHLFGLKTSSLKALEQIIADAYKLAKERQAFVVKDQLQP
ncbi:hypothetical protein Lwor_0915, partial [Legionella worsleiensis]